MTPTKPQRSSAQRLIRWLCMLLALGLFIWWWRYSPPPLVGGGQPDSFFARRLKDQIYRSVGSQDEIGFQRLTAQNANGWYGTFQEPIQSFELYQSQDPVRPTVSRHTIVLQPMGAMNREEKALLQKLKAYGEAFFQLPVRIEKPLTISPTITWRPSSLSRRRDRTGHKQPQLRQYDAEVLVDEFLVPRLPKDAAAYLGITMSDLWAGDMSYVFGMGSFEKRTGVYSLCRYFPEFWGRIRQPGDEKLALRRACQVLNHETGHMLGLQHCVLYKCSMNGCNSLWDGDSSPMDYCPVCHRKLLWNIGCDGIKRYEALLTFYRKYGLPKEAQWTEARLKQYEQLSSSQIGTILRKVTWHYPEPPIRS